MNTGNESEKIFELNLKRQHGKRVFIYRVTDSKEIRGLNKSKRIKTKAQPSDYVITEEGEMYYAEVKSSKNKTSFPFGNISDEQWRASKRQYMAFGVYYFFLHNLNTNLWYKLPAEILHETKSSGVKSLKWKTLTKYEWNIIND